MSTIRVRVSGPHQYFEAGTILNENDRELHVYQDAWGPNYILAPPLFEDLDWRMYLPQSQGPPPWAPCPPRNPHCMVEPPSPVDPQPTHADTPEPGTAVLLCLGLMLMLVARRRWA